MAKGNRIEAIKLVREANAGVDLRGAMEAVDARASGQQSFPVDAVQSKPGIGNGDGLPPEALAALANGQLIEAIKIVRERTGLGLREAKNLMESHRGRLPPARDDAMRAKLEGIARKHGVSIPESALVAMEQGDLKQAMTLLRQAKDSGLAPAGRALGKRDAARSTGTVTHDIHRNGWLWALGLLVLLVLGYFWFQ